MFVLLNTAKCVKKKVLVKILWKWLISRAFQIWPLNFYSKHYFDSH